MKSIITKHIKIQLYKTKKIILFLMLSREVREEEYLMYNLCKILNYREKIFGSVTVKVSKLSWGLQDRYGKNMKGRQVSGTTRTIINRIYINPVTAPPMTKLHLQIGYWGWQQDCYKEKNNKFITTKTITDTHTRWFKWNSLLKLRKVKKWLSPIHCNVKEFCRILHVWNCLNVSAAMSRQ
jgi:hypothetical protein